MAAAIMPPINLDSALSFSNTKPYPRKSVLP